MSLVKKNENQVLNRPTGGGSETGGVESRTGRKERGSVLPKAQMKHGSFFTQRKPQTKLFERQETDE